MLLVLPTATYQAYNTWGGKSLYRDKNGGADTVSGTERAVKVSFDRPLDQNDMDRDRYFGPDFDMVQWLERAGLRRLLHRRRPGAPQPAPSCSSTRCS